MHYYAADVPVGHHISSGRNINCVRFHILQDSKEIAGNYSEILGLLHRYDALACDILGNASAWMVVPEWKDPAGYPEHFETPPIVTIEDPAGENAILEKIRQIQDLRNRKICNTFGLTPQWVFYDPADELIYEINAGRLLWDSAKFKKVLLNIYQEKIYDIFWMNSENGAVFAPYHAGVDVRVPDGAALDSLLERFQAWLPTNGCGFVIRSGDN